MYNTIKSKISYLWSVESPLKKTLSQHICVPIHSELFTGLSVVMVICVSAWHSKWSNTWCDIFMSTDNFQKVWPTKLKRSAFEITYKQLSFTLKDSWKVWKIFCLLFNEELPSLLLQYYYLDEIDVRHAGKCANHPVGHTKRTPLQWFVLFLIHISHFTFYNLPYITSSQMGTELNRFQTRCYTDCRYSFVEKCSTFQVILQNLIWSSHIHIL